MENPTVEEQSVVEENIEEPPKVTWPMLLDQPRDLPVPVDLTHEHLKEIADQLGLIKLAWPIIEQVEFEKRVHSPESYRQNSNKEKLLLLYAENFRRQFVQRFAERKPLFLATYNECGLQKMVCSSIRPTTFSFCELENYSSCVKFFGNHFKYEPLEKPTLLPNRLYSPHTIFLRQSGQSHELATALCSLLLGIGYDAYVVFGYATRDTTLRILIRNDAPYPELWSDENTIVESNDNDIQSTHELRSKYSLMLEQREIDRVEAEKTKQLEIEQMRMKEEEKPPFDELEGRRYHAWILLKAGTRDIDCNIFIEPTTGWIHQLNSSNYLRIESVWNHLNYWVNMQDCTNGLDGIDYDFKNVENWEHLLPGEPIQLRETKTDQTLVEENHEEIEVRKNLEEKHLDMPFSWSLKISLPHEALALRYPDGAIKNQYKRTIVEEYAPYIQTDGLITRIQRFNDFDCTDPKNCVSIFENRNDKRSKLIEDFVTKQTHEYFDRGRDDAVAEHIYYADDDKQTIRYYHEARYDGLTKIEFEPQLMTEEYINRPDRLYYRQVKFAEKGRPPPGLFEGARKIILDIVEKYSRDNSIDADDDIAVREYNQLNREIQLQYHYGDGRVTASTRTFLKPLSLDLGKTFKFHPNLTYGYQSDLNKTPLRQLQLYNLFTDLLKDEQKSIEQVRQVEDMIVEFLQNRNFENANLKLNVPLFNREQNIGMKLAMLEEERKAKEIEEQEADDTIDYLAPYLEKYGNPKRLTYNQANDVRNQCLIDFKNLLLLRAQNMHRQFENGMDELAQKKDWYETNQETITETEEAQYFHEMNQIHFLLQILEIRMTRYKELSHLRYEAMVNYLDNHPLLQILN